MATTANSIIKRSLRLLGVLSSGAEASADESKDALEVLNDMLDQWSNQKLLIYEIVNNLFDITSGTSSYTIGPESSGATWESSEITRPLMMQKYSAFCRDTRSEHATDYPMDYYPNSRFQSILQKNTTSTFPEAWTIDGAYPVATIRLWPVPEMTGLQFGLSEWAQLKKFCALTTYAEFPPGYVSAMAYNLALELAPEYGVSPNAIIVDKSRETKYLLKRTNHKTTLMAVDTPMLNRRVYNVYADGEY